MSLTVKAYLEKDGSCSEIRRFAVDQNVSTSYTYLSNKIPQVFPSLAGKQFDLYWKDAENDYIAFSTDDELTEALGFVNDGMFRVYIRPGTATSQNQPGCCDEGTRHPSVVCDGCEGAIFGSRFKCCVCPDYDLCSGCESKGLHSEHNMFRIRIPGQFWQPGFMDPRGSPFMDPRGPPPFGAPPPPAGGPGPCPPQGPFGPGGGPFGPHGFRPWRHMMKRCWRKWWKDMYQQNTEAAAAEGSDSDKEGKAKEPRREVPKENSEKQGASKGENDGDSPTEEYLKDVGESVAAMLDPLGIDVAVDVECHGKRKKCRGAGGRGRGRGCGRGRGWGWGWGPAMWGMAGRGGWMGGAGFSQDAGCSSWEKPGEKKDEEMQQGTEEKSGASANPGTPSDVHMGSPTHQSEQSDGEWMVYNLNEDEEPSSKDSESTQGETRTEPSAPLHPVPHIASALEQLASMGFNNEGGWLTQLVEAKGGDINKVLDAVKPHSTQPQ